MTKKVFGIAAIALASLLLELLFMWAESSDRSPGFRLNIKPTL